ncbi:hypothetical protein EPA93_00100 [Ktedonosporobacter rubrisoli]|uniref:Class I SAM-dependent methyltransferase n=1 Tax=Ktedonosporobacter rubrisoli TaxID=2509675 RepID=A0A4P6JHI8_KTERU|nr:hypothetical protein [Ktedonosporobacter rubrisoli]QBD74479.1 hypothetical protein EPA93_00100 [Ktedonosporobacter rubrisoli]
MSAEQNDVPSNAFDWNKPETVKRWRGERERRQQVLGVATQRMLEAAHIGPGSHVLDVAAGVGDQALQAARLVGPGQCRQSTSPTRCLK